MAQRFLFEVGLCQFVHRTNKLLFGRKFNISATMPLPIFFRQHCFSHAAMASESPLKKKNKVIGDELAYFDALFPQLVKELTDDVSSPEILDAVNWFREVLRYNTPHGKKNRGLAVVKSYRCLVKPEELTEENLTIARVLGWCVELAYFLVSDDIMDSSETRRGRPCWYKKENVGSIAINDAIYLETCIYALLKKYLRGRPCYIDIIDLFHETTSRTVHGQCLDVCTASPVEKRVDLSRFTTQRYSAIVKYKTAFYSFHLPVALALHLAGICDEASHSIAQKILLEMGHFFQVQDDFLDCYGDPAVTGKIGSDIEDNKCSWLVVQALAKATAEQKQMLQNDYGKTDAACLARVKDLYEELQLKQAYANYEEQSYRTIISLIEHECTTLPRQIFLDFAHMIYKREK